MTKYKPASAYSIRKRIKELIKLGRMYRNPRYQSIYHQVIVLKWVLGDRKYPWLMGSETFKSAIPEIEKYIES